MRAEPDFASKMLSDLQLWGVDKVDGAGVTIAGQMVCTDSGRWSVQREFNRRMKKRFQELGIRLYNPMRTVAVTLPAAAPSEAAGAPGRKPGSHRPGNRLEPPGRNRRMSNPEPLTETIREAGFAFVHAPL